MVPLRRHLAAVLAVAGVLVTSGCVDLEEMQFVKDHRLTFESPEDYALTELPLEVSWTMEDFEIVPKPARAAAPSKRRQDRGRAASAVPAPREDEGYFAVFVDRAPIKPGATLASVGDGDPMCAADPGCPDRAYLEAEGVYTTRRSSLVLDIVEPLASKERIQLHQVTVVLLDSEGRRIGEYAWFRHFKLENKVLDQ